MFRQNVPNFKPKTNPVNETKNFLRGGRGGRAKKEKDSYIEEPRYMYIKISHWIEAKFTVKIIIIRLLKLIRQQ